MHPAYFPVFFWSLAIFASFWGYGEILRRRINRPEFADIGWGLTSAWGTAVVLAIGGLLMAFHLAKAPVLTLVVLFGAAATLFFAAEALFGSKNAKLKIRNQNPAISCVQFPISSFFLFSLAALAFASSIMWPYQIDPNDDVVCYLFFPQKILQTGSLIEPFNVRRMGTYGGQALLQALVMIVGGERNGHVPDRGLGMLMLFGMLMRLTKGVPKPLALLRFLAVGCLFFIAVPRINTGSALTGSVMILALLITLSKINSQINQGRAVIFILSLIAVGAASLRPTYLVCVIGIIVLDVLFRCLSEGCVSMQDVKKIFYYILEIGVVSLMILLPWMCVLWESNRTPMFPPILGGMNLEFSVLGSKIGKLQDVAHAISYFLMPEIICFLLCFGLIGFLKSRALASGASAAIVIVVFITFYKFGVTIFPDDYRYAFPMLMPIGIWLVCASLSLCGKTEDLLVLQNGKVSLVVVIGFIYAVNMTNGARELSAMVDNLPQQFSSTESLVNPLLTKAVRELQGFTPVGSKIFAAVDTPYAFNFARNEIFTADIPGACSIGGWPFKRGPQALNDYLSLLGVRYMMVSDFDNAMLLYTRRHWVEHKRSEWYFKEVWGKYMLDFMDDVDGLKLSNRVVAVSANLRLIEINDSSTLKR